MLSSTIIDPSIAGALAPDAASLAHHESQLIHLLRGLLLNGLLVTDNQNILKRPLRALRCVQQNPKLNVLLTSILQDCTIEIAGRPNLSPSEAIKGIYGTHRSDLVVSGTTAPHPELGDAAVRTKTLADYHLSDAEAQRIEWLHGVGPMDTLGLEAFSTTIRKITAPTKSLKVYDPYLSAEDGHNRRKIGLRFLISNWFQSRLHRPDQRWMEFYCVDQNSPVGISRLETSLRELQGEFPIKFELKVLRDPNHIFHARHLQTSNFITLVDPGFDFFNSDNTLRHVLLKPARGDKEHLRIVRLLSTSYQQVLVP